MAIRRFFRILVTIASYIDLLSDYQMDSNDNAIVGYFFTIDFRHAFPLCNLIVSHDMDERE